MQQITINKSIKLSGVGLHSGKKVNLKLLPAPENTGIIFKRVDVSNVDHQVIKANYLNVTDTKLCTLLSNEFGVKIGTIEHLLSALSALFIDNIIVEVDAPEVPILDGSATIFVKEIEKVGLLHQKANKKILKVLKPVSLENEKWKITILPSDKFSVSATIDFNDKLIGRQSYDFDFITSNYNREISKARTFTFLKDVEYLKSIGLALGGNLDNAIVISDNKVLNATGLRYKNEFVRHKVLDLIGDIYLSGYYIQGKIIAEKMGHEANNMILRELFKDKNNYDIIESIVEYDFNENIKYKHSFN
jgi:UDP-3-O-[3-hydroxymyristoyl] N-acetylglucosamine deacetylase